MRAIAITFLVVLFGCAGSAPTVGDDDGGDPPPKIKQPPMPKDGSSTAPGCDGIPESGACQDGVAAYCEITDGNGSLRRKDCRALGKSCIMDGQRGAMCEVVEGPGPGGGTSPAGCDGVTVEGSCNGQVAVWCDPESATIIQWDCAAEGNSSCSLIPNLGAYCTENGTSTPPPASNECPTLGFYGECSGNTARWCNGDTLVEKQCSGTQTCQLDACADGAFCCNPPQAPPVSECDQIGIRGVCTPEGKPRWCSNGTVQEVTCAAGKTCQIDACGDGAFCCSP